MPLGLVAWSQRDQVAWLTDTNYSWDRMLLNELTSGQSADPDWIRWVFLGGLLVFFALGIRQLWRKGRRWLPSVLALWAGLPTVVAVVCAAVADGGMHPRYVTFAVPAFAIAATIGAFSLPKWTPALAAVAGLAVVVPILVAQRAEDAKPDDLRRLAATAEDQDADAVYFTVSRARSIDAAYPEPFEDKVDISAPLDPEPDPFFPGIRDPATIKGVDVDGLRSARLRHPQRPLRRPAARARLPVGAGHRRPALRRHALHVSQRQPCGPMNESIIAPLPPSGRRRRPAIPVAQRHHASSRSSAESRGRRPATVWSRRRVPVQPEVVDRGYRRCRCRDHDELGRVAVHVDARARRVRSSAANVPSAAPGVELGGVGQVVAGPDRRSAIGADLAHPDSSPGPSTWHRAGVGHHRELRRAQAARSRRLPGSPRGAPGRRSRR